ncbi:MAG: YqjK family protein [Pseudomonadota bacterium]|nr:YqjK family protein [Pseudomonadota bacterium]
MRDESAVDLAVRREQLRLRSAQLREQIAVRTSVFRPVFNATDRVRGGVRSVKSARSNHALALLAGSAVVGALLVRPRLAVNLGLRAWSGWQMFRRVQPLVNSVLRQLG